MPMTRAAGTDIYYERRGAGPRLLFLDGSGATIDRIAMLLSLFEQSFDFLVHDNRGLGQSGPAEAPYTMADCAADAFAVMDAVGWDTARVIGVSFGGMVAQELAVTAPDRVERLALLCTSPGGPTRASYPLHELAELPTEERNQAMRALMDIRFDDEWLAMHPADQAMVAMMEQSRDPGAEPERRTGEMAQLQARKSHDVWDRLPAITCPTLVACGTYDGIAPPANSEAIASRIAGAELRTYEGGHAFFAQDQRALPEVTEFLRR
jgi:3-oxoadipate enol-lactonase